MKVLVTGGAGFIGSHVVEHFQNHAGVRVLGNAHSIRVRNLDGFKHEFIHGSILDRDAVRRAVAGVDFVFHLAALSGGPLSVQDPAACAEINVGGTRVVLEEAARAKVQKLVFSSSAAVYGPGPVMPKAETMPPEPENPYAASKLAAERDGLKFAEEKSLPTACLRYFNVFGPRQEPLRSSRPDFAGLGNAAAPPSTRRGRAGVPQ